LLRARAIGKLLRDPTAFQLQIVQHLVDRGLPEELGALQRGVDLDVEPRFNAACKKLHRDEVHQRARSERHQPQHHQQAQPQPRAELALAIPAHQQHELPDHQGGQQRGERGAETEQQRVMARE